MSDISEDSEMDEQYEEEDMNEHIEENIYVHRDEQHHFLYEEDSTDEQIEPEEDCGVESFEDKLFSELSSQRILLMMHTHFSAMLPTHRKMSNADIMQMMNMMKAGISTSQIFGLLASQAGEYEYVGYGPKDMYNEVARVPVDATWVLKKLEDMHLKDRQLYFKARHDSSGLLRTLFWSDGIS
ncbi:hypothetical protein PIB30_003223 [Stylosanthes scabra]|uniref:Uncharacterized protein n=1 Tax=Stylosanthes scabra TaxID=79078 RepID=A0ABU6Q4A3_9FABA|nr:hypothetical protein [Stylosanthes scabra]